MKARHAVFWALCAAPSAAVGQGVDEWRTRFAAGQEARQAGDVDVYSRATR